MFMLLLLLYKIDSRYNQLDFKSEEIVTICDWLGFKSKEIEVALGFFLRLCVSVCLFI